MEKRAGTNVEWESAKAEYIKQYFSNDEEMQGIAEQAFLGKPYFQELLSDWFDRHDAANQAESWRARAQANRESMGVALDGN